MLVKCSSGKESSACVEATQSVGGKGVVENHKWYTTGEKESNISMNQVVGATK